VFKARISSFRGLDLTLFFDAYAPIGRRHDPPKIGEAMALVSIFTLSKFLPNLVMLGFELSMVRNVLYDKLKF
jgi:hypothetical protein